MWEHIPHQAKPLPGFLKNRYFGPLYSPISPGLGLDYKIERNAVAQHDGGKAQSNYPGNVAIGWVYLAHCKSEQILIQSGPCKDHEVHQVPQESDIRSN